MNSPTIVILGAGIAGLRAALSLKRRLGTRSCRLIVVDKQTHYLPHSELYKLVLPDSDRLIESTSIKQILQDESIEFWQDIIQAIDPIRRKITLYQHQEQMYDYLVIALGSQPDRQAIPGLADHATFFHSIQDVAQLKARIAHRLRLDQPTHFVIGGSGQPGIELAKVLCAFRKPGGPTVTISLIEQASQLLGGQPRNVGDRAANELKKLGIDIYFNQQIKKVQACQIIVGEGRAIEADIFIWAGGLIGNPLIKQAGLDVDATGRAKVNNALQARGYSRVFAIGSAASFSAPDRSPKMPLDVVQQANIVAQNIVRSLRGQLPQNYQSKLRLTLFMN